MLHDTIICRLEKDTAVGGAGSASQLHSRDSPECGSKALKVEQVGLSQCWRGGSCMLPPPPPAGVCWETRTWNVFEHKRGSWEAFLLQGNSPASPSASDV